MDVSNHMYKHTWIRQMIQETSVVEKYQALSNQRDIYFLG